MTENITNVKVPVEDRIEKHIDSIGEIVGDLLPMARRHFDALYGEEPPEPPCGPTPTVCGGLFGDWENRLEYLVGDILKIKQQFNRSTVNKKE